MEQDKFLLYNQQVLDLAILVLTDHSQHQKILLVHSRLQHSVAVDSRSVVLWWSHLMLIHYCPVKITGVNGNCRDLLYIKNDQILHIEQESPEQCITIASILNFSTSSPDIVLKKIVKKSGGNRYCKHFAAWN